VPRAIEKAFVGPYNGHFRTAKNSTKPSSNVQRQNEKEPRQKRGKKTSLRHADSIYGACISNHLKLPCCTAIAITRYNVPFTEPVVAARRLECGTGASRTGHRSLGFSGPVCADSHDAAVVGVGATAQQENGDGSRDVWANQTIATVMTLPSPAARAGSLPALAYEKLCPWLSALVVALFLVLG
jgi:hypothetical protein